MSILSSTKAGSEALSVTSKQYIIDEIAKLDYTYDCLTECWKSNISNMPYLILQENSFSVQSGLFTIYVVYNGISKPHIISYTIIYMLDLFNFIKDLKSIICQS